MPFHFMLVCDVLDLILSGQVTILKDNTSMWQGEAREIGKTK